MSKLHRWIRNGFTQYTDISTVVYNHILEQMLYQTIYNQNKVFNIDVVAIFQMLNRTLSRLTNIFYHKQKKTTCYWKKGLYNGVI